MRNDHYWMDLMKAKGQESKNPHQPTSSFIENAKEIL